MGRNTKQLAVFVLSLGAVLANGQDLNTTLYVNPSGDDANDGGLDRPFRTLGTALAHVTNNTRLVISGSFTNACVPAGFDLPAGLLLANLTNVELAGVEGATLYFTGYGNGLHLGGFTNLTITGLTLVGDRAAVFRTDPWQLGVAGACAIKGTNSGLVIRDCKFLNWPDQAITVWVTFEAVAHRTDNVWVQHCVFANVGTTNFPAGAWTPGDGTCVSSFFGNNVWVQNNYATNCLKFFEFEPAGDVSSANMICGNWHITDNVLVEQTHWLCFTHNYFGVSSHDVWIERNRYKQSAGLVDVPIELRATTNAYIRGNTFIGGSLIVYPQERSDNLVVEGNTFDGGYYSVFAVRDLSSVLGCWNLTVRGNTFKSVHQPLILGAVNTVVESNTFVGLPASEYVCISVLNGGEVAAFGSARGWATNLTFAHNDFLPPFDADSQSWLFVAGSNALDNFRFEGNRDFCASPVTAIFYDPWNYLGWYARSNMFIDQPAGSTGILNGNVKAASGSRWMVGGVTYVNTGDANWEPETSEVVGPNILSQPIGQSQVPGLSATFTVGAGGAPPLSYQWQFNGTDIPGATAPSFTVPNVQSTNLGGYRVLVTNSVGSIVSSEAPLEFGQIAAWGSPSDLVARSLAVPIEATNVLAVAAGHFFNTALNADGTLLGWGGFNLKGETTLPVDLPDVVAIAGGGDTALALRSGGTVVAWGDDTFGQADVPADLANVVALAAGDCHSLALQADGTVAAWGGAFGEADVPAGLENVVAIAAGSRFSLALKADGTMTGWGCGLAAPPDLTNVVAIAAGVEHALALLGNGTVVAWGQNTFGQSSVPTGLSNVVAIAAGAHHSLALLANGTVAGWGDSDSGQTNIPAALTNVVAISAGDEHSLAIIGGGPPVLNAPASNPALSEDGFRLSVPSQCGRVYALEYKNAPADADWTGLPLVAGNGGDLVLTDPSPATSQRFYRVRRW